MRHAQADKHKRQQQGSGVAEASLLLAALTRELA